MSAAEGPAVNENEQSEYFVKLLASFADSLARKIPNNESVQHVQQKMMLYRSLGADKNPGSNAAVMKAWTDITADLDSVIEKRDASALCTHTAKLRENHGDNMLTQLDPGSILSDPAVPDDTKDLIWMYVEKLDGVGKGRLQPPKKPTGSKNNVPAASRSQQQAAAASILGGDKSAQFAEQIRAAGPQMLELLNGIMTGKSDHPVLKALNELVDPEKPEGKTARALMDMAKEKIGVGDGDGSLMDTLGSASGGADMATVQELRELVEDLREELYKVRERVANLEGQNAIARRVERALAKKPVTESAW